MAKIPVAFKPTVANTFVGPIPFGKPQIETESLPKFEGGHKWGLCQRHPVEPEQTTGPLDFVTVPGEPESDRSRSSGIIKV